MTMGRTLETIKFLSIAGVGLFGDGSVSKRTADTISRV